MATPTKPLPPDRVTGDTPTGGVAADVMALRDALAEMRTLSDVALDVVAAVTTSGTLAVETHTPVDASGGPVTRTLPTPTRIGQRIRVEKLDSSSNTVIVTGTLRGAAGSVTMPFQYEVREFAAESLTSWRVSGGNTPKAALDAYFLTQTAAAGAYAQVPNTTDYGYDAVLLLGQSNMQGDSAGAVAANVDVTSPRVWMWGATGTYAGQLVQASDPLPHRGGSSVVGPGMSLANWLSPGLRGNRRLLLIPAAANGTAFGSGTTRWDPYNTWPNDTNNLYNQAITQALAALAAAPKARLVAAFWVQGESDAIAGMTGTTYRGFLESLIDGLRSRLSLPTLPFVIGSMLPEFTAQNATNAAIDAVHQAIPTRKPYTAYVAGPSGVQRGDNLHYAPAGQREQGRRLAAGLATAMANSAPASAVPANPPAPPVPPVTSVADNFNRADSATTMGTTSTGGVAWAPQSGTWGISSQQAYCATSGSNVVTVSVSSVDHYSEAKITTRDSGTCVLARCTAANSWYALLVSSTDGTVTAYKSVAGTVTSLGSMGSGSVNGDVWRITAKGTLLTFAKNGTQVGSVTDTSLTGGNPGLRVDTTSARFDDFSAAAV